MPFFRKKPVVIEAVLWNGYSNNLGLTTGDPMAPETRHLARYEMPDWMPPISNMLGRQMLGTIPAVPPGSVWRGGDRLWIGTLEGPHVAEPGDWIIKGVKGELYPCKPDIFAMTYEPAEAPAAPMRVTPAGADDFDLPEGAVQPVSP